LDRVVKLGGDWVKLGFKYGEIGFG